MPIRSLRSEDFSDLSFLDDVLAGREIVQLGEVAHGIAEQNQGRVRLIKYLHQRLGFSVVSFESSFFGCAMANGHIDSLSAKGALMGSLYSMWRTTGILELFEYIEETRSSANPLYLAGFDVRPTGALCEMRPSFLANVVSGVDTALAADIRTVDGELVLWHKDRPTTDAYVSAHHDTLVTLYDRLVRTLEKGEPSLRSRVGVWCVLVGARHRRSPPVEVLCPRAPWVLKNSSR